MTNQGDRVFLKKETIINEEKGLWNEVFYHSSTKRRKRYIHPRRIQGPDRGIVIHFRLK
jgi:hypothetical protein